jgi:hypothetical protein
MMSFILSTQISAIRSRMISAIHKCPIDMLLEKELKHCWTNLSQNGQLDDALHCETLKRSNPAAILN